jgi:hypothetical protein
MLANLANFHGRIEICLSFQSFRNSRQFLTEMLQFHAVRVSGLIDPLPFRQDFYALIFFFFYKSSFLKKFIGSFCITFYSEKKKKIFQAKNFFENRTFTKFSKKFLKFFCKTSYFVLRVILTRDIVFIDFFETRIEVLSEDF